MIILNDLHIDTQRAAGTTQNSVFGLNRWLLTWLESTLATRPHEDLLINGDLFDRYSISNSLLLWLYSILLSHAMAGAKIYLVRGNHDYAKDSTKMPSIELLYNLLAKVCDVEYIEKEEVQIRDDVWVIPHVKNQDEFSAALKRVLEYSPKMLFLHCNYDNGFALESDHSLNISRDIALKFGAKGTVLVLGHEHHEREVDNAIILGNQLPTSIYDCLGGGNKHYHILHEDLSLEKVVSWHESQYADLSCHDDFESVSAGLQFIRVSGEVSPEEFPAINRKITELRKKHSAFVISSALQLTTAVDEEGIAASVDKLKQYEILPEILKLVKDKKQKAALAAIVAEMEETT